MREMKPRTVRAVAIAAVVATVLGVALYAAFRSPPKRITAYFTSAVGVYPGSSVRVLGIQIGKVTKVKAGRGSVEVDISYDRRYKVPVNPAAEIVPPSIVADRYIALGPVYSSGPFLGDHATIQTDHTATPVEIDQIYSALNTLASALGPNGANASGSSKQGPLSDLITVSAADLKGNGAALGNSISQLAKVAKAFADSSPDLVSTIKNLVAFTKTLNDDDANIRSFSSLLAQVAGNLAGEKQSLATALTNLNSALAAVGKFLTANQATVHTSIAGLVNITTTLQQQSGAINELLAVAPTALSNVINAYDPTTQTIRVRANLSTLVAPYGSQYNGATVSADSICEALRDAGDLAYASAETRNHCASVPAGGAAAAAADYVAIVPGADQGATGSALGTAVATNPGDGLPLVLGASAGGSQ